MASVDASNCSIPLSHPLVSLGPPLPSTTRGEPCVISGKGGRFNGDRRVLLYGSGKAVVVRYLLEDTVFVYRGHLFPVTAAKLAPSGCFVASGDARGKLRVWSFDNEEHLCKLDLQIMTGPIRDISWDFESKRVSEGEAIVEFCASMFQSNVSRVLDFSWRALVVSLRSAHFYSISLPLSENASTPVPIAPRSFNGTLASPAESWGSILVDELPRAI